MGTRFQLHQDHSVRRSFPRFSIFKQGVALYLEFARRQVHAPRPLSAIQFIETQ